MADLDVKSESVTGSISASHPLIRSRGENLSLSGNFTYKTSKTNAAGAVLTQDRHRTVNLGSSYDFVDSWLGINLFSGSVTQGLDIMGATERDAANISRARGRSDFTKLNASALRLQRVLPGFSVLAAAQGQWSAHTLLSAEEFGVGGAQFGRGYDPSEITGDHGYSLKIEPQYGNAVDSEYLVDYQVYGFYDFGMVWNTQDTDRESLASTGFGVRTNITEWASSFAEMAFPLTRPVGSRGTEGGEMRVFFGFTVRN
ncbi:MAG: ShlB/FhaC/HecB family hemolysin secretion/activation protein [Rhodospirillaceae bacterium]|nr:ShlB/FhaC/HecB family hemolysin secretion/activation protein [Rhodospirillaceae bacterium]MBT4427076.1 ShlB/FhaC/HecB family hemolysin secretion/activation protein [Rhodospirillaceae bacterium]MBT5037246.1 ShlB/FhaC/HecB family hemolysin secretion/activation protein [Rhodospirillaceae bacterium]MBT5674118.1 ShlB/FhaC/HecB family hemolysin secretion/activation protein [Rhodospirillaceae bacterium]MBT5778365.1 ShlB/FhaC/HecB family hemolysin secretion/activation protein [Rhodospirillaceae bact